MISEEETNESIKEYKRLLEGIKSIFDEFENANKIKDNEKIDLRKTFKKRETRAYQILNYHELYKFLLISNYYRGKLTLLDEKQSTDENDSYQKIMDLFLEENDTIPHISQSSGDVNKYLLTQLYTAFSLLERKVYIDGGNIDPSLEEEKNRNFLKHLNSIKFDKNSKITNQILEYFNHNILRIEDIYQSNESKINFEEIKRKKRSSEKYDPKSLPLEAYEIKKKYDINMNNLNNFNQFDNFDYNGNVILNNDNKDEALQQVDSISYEKNYRNIDYDNEEYKRLKSVNMRKILEISDEKLKNISMGDFQELISEVYENGTINKELEDKITGGKGGLFSHNNNSEDNKDKNSFSLKIPNDIEISINSGEDNKIVDDEEIIDDRDLDFEQEEIKNDRNRNSFFEKGDDFSKDFFQNNSEDEKINNNNISQTGNFSLSNSNSRSSS